MMGGAKCRSVSSFIPPDGQTEAWMGGQTYGQTHRHHSLAPENRGWAFYASAANPTVKLINPASPTSLPRLRGTAATSSFARQHSKMRYQAHCTPIFFVIVATRRAPSPKAATKCITCRLHCPRGRAAVNKLWRCDLDVLGAMLGITASVYECPEAMKAS